MCSDASCGIANGERDCKSRAAVEIIRDDIVFRQPRKQPSRGREPRRFIPGYSCISSSRRLHQKFAEGGSRTEAAMKILDKMYRADAE